MVFQMTYPQILNAKTDSKFSWVGQSARALYHHFKGSEYCMCYSYSYVLYIVYEKKKLIE